MEQAPRREPIAEPLQQAGRPGCRFAGPEGGHVPLVPFAVVDRDEGRLAPHREPHVPGAEPLVDPVAERLDRSRHCSSVYGLVTRGVSSIRVTSMWNANSGRTSSFSLAGSFVKPNEPVIGAGAEGIGRAGERDVTLAREQARGRVEADPARPRHVHLGPGVEVGEVELRPRRTIEGLDVGLELDQVARDEPGGQAEVAEDLDQQPAGVAARPARQGQRLLGRLDARLHPDQVLDLAAEPLVDLDQVIDRADVAPPQLLDQRAEPRTRRLASRR